MTPERLAQIHRFHESYPWLGAMQELLDYVDQLIGERDRARDLAVRSGVFETSGGPNYALTPEEF